MNWLRTLQSQLEIQWRPRKGNLPLIVVTLTYSIAVPLDIVTNVCTNHPYKFYEWTHNYIGFSINEIRYVKMHKLNKYLARLVMAVLYVISDNDHIY